MTGNLFYCEHKILFVDFYESAPSQPGDPSLRGYIRSGMGPSQPGDPSLRGYTRSRKGPSQPGDPSLQGYIRSGMGNVATWRPLIPRLHSLPDRTVATWRPSASYSQILTHTSNIRLLKRIITYKLT